MEHKKVIVTEAMLITRFISIYNNDRHWSSNCFQINAILRDVIEHYTNLKPRLVKGYKVCKGTTTKMRHFWVEVERDVIGLEIHDVTMFDEVTKFVAGLGMTYKLYTNDHKDINDYDEPTIISYKRTKIALDILYSEYQKGKNKSKFWKHYITLSHKLFGKPASDDVKPIEYIKCRNHFFKTTVGILLNDLGKRKPKY